MVSWKTGELSQVVAKVSVEYRKGYCSSIVGTEKNRRCADVGIKDADHSEVVINT